MPFYEYECENCKFYQELLQKVSDPPLEKCPSCGKKKMKKLVSAPVFRLKGGGWYETDFKGDKENKRNLATDKEPDSAADSKPKPAATADSKTDAKPAAESKPSEPATSAASVRTSAAKPKTRAAAKPASKPAAKPAAKAKKKARR
jgi:putative FmdB family regulatory protein